MFQVKKKLKCKKSGLPVIRYEKIDIKYIKGVTTSGYN